jgi:plasmid stability protein
MSAVVIRDLPPALHQRLRIEAQRHHRSMNGEVIAILEKELGTTRPVELPPPVKGIKPVDPQWIVRVIREARESRP